MTPYAHFRDEAVWEPSLGESEYAGVPNFGPPVMISVRDAGEALTRRGGDTVQRHVYWTLPEHEVKVGDHLDGRPVLEIEDAKDTAGNLLYRVCHAQV